MWLCCKVKEEWESMARLTFALLYCIANMTHYSIIIEYVVEVASDSI